MQPGAVSSEGYQEAKCFRAILKINVISFTHGAWRLMLPSLTVGLLTQSPGDSLIIGSNCCCNVTPLNLSSRRSGNRVHDVNRCRTFELGKGRPAVCDQILLRGGPFQHHGGGDTFTIDTIRNTETAGF